MKFPFWTCCTCTVGMMRFSTSESKDRQCTYNESKIAISHSLKGMKRQSQLQMCLPKVNHSLTVDSSAGRGKWYTRWNHRLAHSCLKNLKSWGCNNRDSHIENPVTFARELCSFYKSTTAEDFRCVTIKV